jgi:hypothetical protein
MLSDHFPLLLDCGTHREEKRYFKFENMWLKSEGFVEQVQRWWESYNLRGLLSYVLAKKIESFKGGFEEVE